MEKKNDFNKNGIHKCLLCYNGACSKQYKIQTKDLCKQAKLANINYKKK